MPDYQDPLVVGPADGNVRGDTKPMPNRGTSTGMVGMGAPYGASIDANATNSKGSAHMDGDPMDLCYPKGDADLRFSSAGANAPDPGTHFTAGSDPIDEVMPDDTRGSPDPDNT